MDETVRRVLIDQLAEVEGEIAQLQGVATFLRRKLGQDVTDSGAGDGSEHVRAGEDPVASVHEGEFYSLSATKASRAVLERSGKHLPIKTDELFEAITKGGAKIANTNVLYRSLARDSAFHNTGRGVWGLSEWYPNRVRTKSRGSNGQNDNEHLVSSNDDTEVGPETAADDSTGLS